MIEERTDSPVKTSQIRSFIKNIGLPSSPVLGKKAPPATTATTNASTVKTVTASGRKVSTATEPATTAAKNKGKETKQGWHFFMQKSLRKLVYCKMRYVDMHKLGR